jgi:prophage regulatory protein
VPNDVHRSPERILRCADVLNRRGVGRSTMYADVAVGLFPSPVRIGKRSVGWPESEVDALVRARVAGKSTDQIRTLVKALEGKRQFACDGIEA